MKKYWHRLLMSAQRQFAYRARVLIYILLDLSLFFVFPFLWLSVFQDKISIGGYTQQSIITYYVVAGFVTLLSSSHSSRFIHEDIRSGKMSTNLLRPLHYFLWHFSGEAGYRIISLVVTVPLFACLFWKFPEYLILPEHASTWIFFAVSIFGAWILSALFQYIVGMTAFWFGESGFAFQIRWFLEKIFSGELAPLPLMPLLIQKVAVFLPFQFLFFFPIQVYLEKLTWSEMLHSFAIEFSCILVLTLIVAQMWKKGLKNYDGGGI